MAEQPEPPEAASTSFVLKSQKSFGTQWGKLRSRVTGIGKILRLQRELQERERPPSPPLVTAQEVPEVNPLSLAGKQAKGGLLREVFREFRLVWRLDRMGIEEQIIQNFLNSVKQGASCFEFLDFDYSKVDLAEPEQLNQQARYIRCYVSSPYADMQAERRLLAQEAFPTLRQRCMQLGIHFTEVDFCWGVAQQKAERKASVMQRVTEIRQNVKTYIVGLVGERYGYTYILDSSLNSGSIDPLFKAKKAQVVGLAEIELDEGALSTDVPHRGFYYFRDPKYLNEIEDKEIRDTLQSEGLLARERLSSMKAKLRMSSVEIVESYKDPEHLANQVIQDLSEQISEDFPEECDAQTIANVDKYIMQEFEQMTLDGFEGREEDMNILDERVLGVQSFDMPTVVSGEAGVGKSAFLVAWSRRFEQRNPVDLLFKHYAGLHPESGCWATIVKLILDAMRKAFGLRKEVPNDIRLLPGALSLWTNNLASLSARMIVMIDAVECVHDILFEPQIANRNFDVEEDEDNKGNEDEERTDAVEDMHAEASTKVKQVLHSLSWLPKALPSNIRMVVSCSEESDALRQLKRRRWNVMKLGPISAENRTHIMERLLKARGVTMPEPLQDRLSERTRTLNPLFLVQILRTVNEPSDMKPSGTVATYILCRNLRELINTMILKLENKPGVQERHGLVEEILSAIALSRRGLSEAELLQIVQVPRALFTWFYLESRPLFKLQFGLLSLSSTTLHTFVMERYLEDQDTRINVRLRIADFFQNRLMSHRAVEETPWQLLQCHRWSETSSFIMRPEPFMTLSSTSVGMFDLIVYWDHLGDPERGNLSLVDKCEDCARMASEVQMVPASEVELMNRLAELLQRMEFFDSAVGFIRRARAMEERHFGLSILNSFDYTTREARILRERGDYLGARRTYQRIVEQLTSLVDTDGDGNISYEEMKATEAGTVLLETEEEFMHLLWQGGFWMQLEDMCIQMLERDEGRPTNELLLFDMLVHSYLERGKYDSAQEFGQRALKAVDDHQSMEYRHVLERNVGLFLMLEQYQKLVEMVESELDDRGTEVGRDMEFELADIDMLGMYALSLCRTGRTDEATVILDAIVQKVHAGEVPPSPTQSNRNSPMSESSDEDSELGSKAEDQEAGSRTGVIITDIMVLALAGHTHRERSHWLQAEDYFQRAISLSVLSFGTKDPSIAYFLGEIASLYEARRDQKRAFEMRQTAIVLVKDAVGPGLFSFRAVLALASTHWKFGDYAKAEALATQVVYGVENRFGSRHELLPRALLLLGMALMTQGKLQPAQEILSRAQRLGSALWGGHHSDAIDAAFASAQAEELRGEYRRAEMALLEVLQTRTAVWGPDHAGVQQVLVAMALLYFRIDALPEVEELLWKALPGIQHCHGPDSLPVASLLSLLALVHAQVGTSVNGHTADLVALVLRALRIRVSVLGASTTAGVQHTIYTALLLVHTGELGRAEPLLRQGYRALQASLQPPASTLPLRKLVYAHLERCNAEAFPEESRPPMPEWSDEHDPDLQAENIASDGQEISETVTQLLGIPLGGWDAEPALVSEDPAGESPAPDSEESSAEDWRSPDDITSDAMGDENASSDEPPDARGIPVFRRLVSDGSERPSSAPGIRQSRPPRPTSASAAARPLSAAESGRTGSAARTAAEAAGRLQSLQPVRVEGRAATSDEEAEEAPAPPPPPVVRRRSKRVVVNVDARDEGGNTALHLAVREGDVAAVRSLLEGAASPTAQNRAGEAPLHVAAARGDVGVLRMLVGALGGESIDLPGPRDATALYLAVEVGAGAAAELLCSEGGADPVAAASDGTTPYSVAADRAAEAATGEGPGGTAALRVLRALDLARSRAMIP